MLYALNVHGCICHCRHCDAQVGTGRATKLCTSFCTTLFESCRHDYFEHLGAGELVACKSNSYVCSMLSEFVGSSAQMCKNLALFHDPDSGACYDGEPSKATASCLVEKTSSGKPRKVMPHI